MTDGEDRKDEARSSEEHSTKASDGTTRSDKEVLAAGATEGEQKPDASESTANQAALDTGERATLEDAAIETAPSSEAASASPDSAKTASEGESGSEAASAGEVQGAAQEEGHKPRRREATGKAPRNSSSRTAVWIVAAMVVGAAGGWFAREARAHTVLLGSATHAEGGSCQAWESQICEALGAEAIACQEVKAAAALLPTAACDEALDAVPDTLAKAKEAREVCDGLVSRICADLGESTQTCEMVKQRTESFPPSRCQEMVGNYDQVIGQLRMMEQRGAMPRMQVHGGHSPHGAQIPQGTQSQQAPSKAAPPPANAEPKPPSAPQKAAAPPANAEPKPPGAPQKAATPPANAAPKSPNTAHSPAP